MTRSLHLLLACALVACTSEPPLIPADSGVADAGAHDAAADAGLPYDVFFDEGMGEAIAERFRSAAPSPVAAPEILYPESGTLVPPNVFGLDVHFRAAVLQSFEITFSQADSPSVVAYVRCARVGDGCIFQPWREVWGALVARRAAGPYAIRIRALAGEEVTAASAPVVLELASEKIVGGVYFSATDEDPPTIRRHELGLERRSSETFLELWGYSPSHVVSRDGARIAVATVLDVGGSETRIYDVSTRAPIATVIEPDLLLPRFGAGHDILFSALLADVHHEPPIRILSGTDGAILHEWTSLGAAHSADWSADGDRIVFSVTTGIRGIHFEHDLRVIERDESGEWNEPRTIPTGNVRSYQPSFSPDPDWIGYSAIDFDDQDVHGTYAPLLVAQRISDARIVELRRAHGDVSRYGGEAGTGLRWNPSPYTHAGRRIFWFTFASGRGCGLLPMAEEPVLPGRQIWMAAFDPEADPDDPSRPAFRLPAQRWGYTNGTAEWSLSVRRQPCSDGSECPRGELCQDGFCHEAPQ